MSGCDKKLGELKVQFSLFTSKLSLTTFVKGLVRCWMQTCFKYISCKLGERLGEMLGLDESLLAVISVFRDEKSEIVQGMAREENIDIASEPQPRQIHFSFSFFLIK